MSSAQPADPVDDLLNALVISVRSNYIWSKGEHHAQNIERGGI